MLRRTALAIVLVGGVSLVDQAREPGGEAGARVASAVDLAGLAARPDSIGVPVSVSFRYALPDSRVEALLGSPGARAVSVLDSARQRVRPECGRAPVGPEAPEAATLRRLERSLALLRNGGAIVERVDAVVAPEVVANLAVDPAVREVFDGRSPAGSSGTRQAMEAEVVRRSCPPGGRGSG